MIRETFPVGPLRCNCTVLGDEVSREATVIDPGDDIPGIIERLTRSKLRLKQIIVTHAHIDHIAGAVELKRITGAPILYNQADLPLVAMMEVQAGWLGIATPEVCPPDDDLVDCAQITIGELQGQILHTPGHTQGSSCLYFAADSLLIAGDTLFEGSVGRTDLPGGHTQSLLRSIKERLLTLPDNTVVIAGHGASTTIGRERLTNPFLQEI